MKNKNAIKEFIGSYQNDPVVKRCQELFKDSITPDEQDIHYLIDKLQPVKEMKSVKEVMDFLKTEKAIDFFKKERNKRTVITFFIVACLLKHIFKGEMLYEEDTISINSSLANKILKECIPYSLKGKRFNNMNVVKSDLHIKATYNNNGNKIDIQIKDLNDIPILLKKDIKFIRFYDFFLHCLMTNGRLINGVLMLPYREWLEYTGRKVTDRMIKQARKEVNEFWQILKNIEISTETKWNKKIQAIPSSSCDTKSNRYMAEFSIDNKFIEMIGKDFYTLPKVAGRLKDNVYSLVTFIYWYAKVNTKNSGEPFNLRYAELYQRSGLPEYEIVNNGNRAYTERMFYPFDKYIQQIREELDKYINIEYEIPESWEKAKLINIKITLKGINYKSIKEKKKKHNTTLKGV